MREWLLQLFGFGKVTATDDTGDALRLQVTQGRRGTKEQPWILNNLISFSQFGVAAVPPIGAGVMMAHIGGDRTQSLVVGTQHAESRPKGLKPGDSVLYDVRGQHVQLTEDGLEIDCAGLPAKITNTTTLRVEAEDLVLVVGATEISLKTLFEAYQAHKHTGVTTGAGLSGLTDHPAT